MRKLSYSEFINRAKRKYDDCFDYSKVNYVNSTTPVEIYCKKCDKTFNQTPRRHISSGCLSCKQSSRIKYDTKTFIEIASKRYGDLFGYNQVDYISYKSNIKIFCRKCKMYFWTTPKNHLTTARCSRCAKTSSNAALKWIESLLPEYPTMQYIKSEMWPIEVGKIGNKLTGYVQESHTGFIFINCYWSACRNTNCRYYKEPNLKHPTKNQTYGEVYESQKNKFTWYKNFLDKLVVRWSCGSTDGSSIDTPQ